MIAIISGIYLNFTQFLMGGPANIKNNGERGTDQLLQRGIVNVRDT